MINVLFVCYGNICRSPMAEFFFKDLLQKEKIKNTFAVASAATHRDELGRPVYPPARRKLAEHGISCAGKTARLMVKEDYGNYDLLIGMERSNVQDMRRICGGDPDSKISLLLDWCGLHRDVDDPWYTGDFDAAWNDITLGCRGLLTALQGGKYHV